MTERAILHIDMNNFYASVECMLNPDLKPFPIAVCGSQEERHGIVLAKNYAAKAKGVSTGEAIWQAKQKCPKVGGCGIRYTVMVEGLPRYLYDEDGKWFMEDEVIIEVQ